MNYEEYQYAIISLDEKFTAHIKRILNPAITADHIISAGSLTRLPVSQKTIVLFDARTLNVQSMECARQFKKRKRDAKFLIISDNMDPHEIRNWMRLGAVDYLTPPLDSKELLNAVQRMVDLDHSQNFNDSQVMGVFSLKGGQGVTSIATNMTDHITRLTHEKNLLMDLNLYMGHMSVLLNQKCTYTPFNLVRDLPRADEDLLLSSIEKHENGFHLLGVSDEIADAEQISREDVKSMLQVLRKVFNFIVVDLPHDFSNQTLAALDESDSILLVVQQSVPSLKSAQMAIQIFGELGYPDHKVHVVLNRYLSRNPIQHDDIEVALNKPVFMSLENNYPVMSEVFNSGQTIHSFERHSDINITFHHFAAKLIGVNPALKRMRTLKRLFSRIKGS